MRRFKPIGVLFLTLLLATTAMYVNSTRQLWGARNAEASISLSDNVIQPHETINLEPNSVISRFIYMGSIVDVLVSWRVIANKSLLEDIRTRLYEMLSKKFQEENCTLSPPNSSDIPARCLTLANFYKEPLKALRILSEEIDLVGILEVNVTIVNRGPRVLTILGTCPWSSLIKDSAMAALGTREDRFGIDERVGISVVQGDYAVDMWYRCIPLYSKTMQLGVNITNIFYFLIKRPSQNESFKGEFFIRTIGICECDVNFVSHLVYIGWENCKSLNVKAYIEWNGTK
jgi:hypothetical protein